MTNKHTATLPDGKIATRNSAKAHYSHVIALGPVPKAHVIADLKRSIVDHEIYATEYAFVLAYIENGGELANYSSPEQFGQRGVMATGISWSHPAMRNRRNSAGRDEVRVGHPLLGWSTEDAVADRDTIAARYRDYELSAIEKIAKDRARVVELEASADEFIGSWGAVSWASRADLAEKAAVTFRKHWQPSGREVRIIPTEMYRSKPRAK